MLPRMVDGRMIQFQSLSRDSSRCRSARPTGVGLATVAFQSLSRDSSRCSWSRSGVPIGEYWVSIPLEGFIALQGSICSSLLSRLSCFNPSRGIHRAAGGKEKTNGSVQSEFQSLSRDSSRCSSKQNGAPQTREPRRFNPSRGIHRAAASSRWAPRTPRVRVSIPLEGFIALQKAWFVPNAGTYPVSIPLEGFIALQVMGRLP